MISKLQELFRSDEFINSSVVFPNIDWDRLARELDLAAEGTARGGDGLPETASSNPDHIELKAISRVEELRRKGLENFETNRRVYSERLNSSVSARMLVETEANDSIARFAEEVTRWRALMVTPRERVQETYRWRSRFRELNHLYNRPAKQATSLANIIGLSLVMILLESAGNAYLFAQNNPLGILGGLIAAFLVSFINVSMSTIMGMGVRYINVKGLLNLLKKVFGLLFASAWFAFALGYNAAIAHFRDAVETESEWREAGELAMKTLIENPIGLNTIESYLLFLLGFFISVIALLKGYHSSDPCPGYSKVAQDLIDARNDYIDHLEDSIAKLAEHRDDAVVALQEARDEVERQVRDSVDALYGQKALQSNLYPFLEQCNIAANYLLSIYRDSNKAARSDDPPAYFQQEFLFEAFTSPVAEDEQRTEAEKQARDVSLLVENSVKEIFAVFHKAVQEHYEIDELEGNYVERSKKFELPLPATSESFSMTRDSERRAAD